MSTQPYSVLEADIVRPPLGRTTVTIPGLVIPGGVSVTDPFNLDHVRVSSFNLDGKDTMKITARDPNVSTSLMLESSNATQGKIYVDNADGNVTIDSTTDVKFNVPNGLVKFTPSLVNVVGQFYYDPSDPHSANIATLGGEGGDPFTRKTGWLFNQDTINDIRLPFTIFIPPNRSTTTDLEINLRLIYQMQATEPGHTVAFSLYASVYNMDTGQTIFDISQTKTILGAATNEIAIADYFPVNAAAVNHYPLLIRGHLMKAHGQSYTASTLIISIYAEYSADTV
jgi:hypothetical protein